MEDGAKRKGTLRAGGWCATLMHWGYSLSSLTHFSKLFQTQEKAYSVVK